MWACSFAFGGRGIFFGGKNILLSELSGAFAIAAEVDSADRQGNFRSARITVQFGGPHLASAQRYLQAILVYPVILLLHQAPLASDSRHGKRNKTSKAYTLQPNQLP